MANFDYDRLSVNELTVDTLNLVRDGNMIIKSNTAIRLNSLDTSLILNNNSIHLNSAEVAINDVNLTEFVANFDGVTFVKNVKINDGDIINPDNNGTVNLTIDTDYLKLNEDGALVIETTTIDENGVDTNKVSTDEIQLDTLQITKDGITNNAFSLNINAVNATTITVENKPVALAEDIPDISGLTTTVNTHTDDISALNTQVSANTSDITNLTSAVNNKQDSLTFDEEPIENSGNPVTSGGVFTALQNQTVTFDNELSNDSENGVQNKVIKAALDNKVESSDFNTEISNLTTIVDENKTEYTNLINAETTARESACTTLQSNIDNLAEVARTGDYTDLSNTPTIPVVDENLSDSTNAIQNSAVNAAINALQSQINLSKQQIKIQNIILDNNNLCVYVDKNITSDYEVTASGVIIDSAADITNINEDTVIIDTYASSIISLNTSNKQLKVVTKGVSAVNANDYIYIRAYVTITKNEETNGEPITVYSPLYIVTKTELTDWTNYYPFVWQ